MNFQALHMIPVDKSIVTGSINSILDTYIYIPIGSMYGVFTNICPKNHPNVGKYTIHGAYGIYIYIYT